MSGSRILDSKSWPWWDELRSHGGGALVVPLGSGQGVGRLYPGPNSRGRRQPGLALPGNSTAVCRKFGQSEKRRRRLTASDRNRLARAFTLSFNSPTKAGCLGTTALVAGEGDSTWWQEAHCPAVGPQAGFGEAREQTHSSRAHSHHYFRRVIIIIISFIDRRPISPKAGGHGVLASPKPPEPCATGVHYT